MSTGAMGAAATEPLSLEQTAPDATQPPAAPRPTPQTTVESVIYSVRERGLKALKEPATHERLTRCDAAARAQINQRIEKLLVADRIPGGAIDA
jgi:hypothetical protein